ncbi:hypothetical protein [Sinorhizobium fredii]|uniref:hypothetical protein n=1 Tax=Rhizobium fredii TaxID=380 RepID=UPI0012FD299B|nr:hypothetical protein [Sinorhizobium fredii]
MNISKMNWVKWGLIALTAVFLVLSLRMGDTIAVAATIVFGAGSLYLQYLEWRAQRASAADGDFEERIRDLRVLIPSEGLHISLIDPGNHLLMRSGIGNRSEIGGDEFFKGLRTGIEGILDKKKKAESTRLEVTGVPIGTLEEFQSRLGTLKGMIDKLSPRYQEKANSYELHRTEELLASLLREHQAASVGR